MSPIANQCAPSNRGQPNEVNMFNDEIHVKAQAEARYYLATKRREMLRREARVLFSVIGITLSVIFIFAIA